MRKVEKTTFDVSDIYWIIRY